MAQRSSFFRPTKTAFLLLVTSLAWGACGNDDSGDSAADAQGPGGAGGSPGGTAGEGGDGAVGGGGMGGLSASGGSTSAEVLYKVPAAGGKVSLKTKGGNTLAFEFPPSAAGLAVKLTPGTSEDLGWDAKKFSDVVHMEPDGTAFTDPVIVKNTKKRPIAFSFPKGAGKTKPEKLELSDDGLAHKVHHFSSVAFLSEEESCDSGNGWTVNPEGTYCVEYSPTATTQLTYSCSGGEFCGYLYGSCCVGAGVTSCSLGDVALSITFEPYADIATYPYCADATGTGGFAGASSGGTGGVTAIGGSGGLAMGGTGG